MQFDEAARDPQAGVTWNETVHQTVRRLFNEAGYDLPEIVYWNIKGGGGITGTLPARADQPGVQLLSGYSASLMKTFLGKANDYNQAEEACNETASRDSEEDGEIVNIPDISDYFNKKEQNVKPSSADKGGTEEITPAIKLAEILANPSFSKLRVFD